VVHPVITSHDNLGDGPRTSWIVDGYFDRGPRERAWFGSSVVWQHRTIEDYVRLVTGHRSRVPVGLVERVRTEGRALCRRHR